MKKNKLSKEAQHLDTKINELAETTTRKLKKVRPEGSYQFHNSITKPKVPEAKKQKWILVNKQGLLSGILDHAAFDTRKKLKHGFRTSDISGGTINIDDYYYVLKNEEYNLLNEIDALDKLGAIDMISDLDAN